MIEEIAASVAAAETIMTAVAAELSELYGFDPDELKEFREDAIATMNEIFGTPTPVP